jgi:hypothetical protein
VFHQDELTKKCDECDIFLTKRSRTLIAKILHYGKVACLAGENIFAMHQDKGAEERVDEYMHSMISEKSYTEVDSYLPAVFEFIISRIGVKSAIDKAKKCTDEEVKEMMTH